MNQAPLNADADDLGFSRRTRLLLFFVGNVVPSLLLMTSSKSNAFRVDWQSGKFYDYAALLMSGVSGWIFYPFFIYAIASFTLGALRPRQFCHSRLVLFGIMTGVLLSLQTCFLLGVVWMQIEQVNSSRFVLLVSLVMPLWATVAVGFPWVFPWLIKWFYGKGAAAARHSWSLPFLMFGCPVTGLALAALFGDRASDGVVFLLFWAVAFVVAAAPWWMVAAYVRLLICLVAFQNTRLRYRLSDLLIVLSWLGAFLAAWRFAVEQAVETYATLPTSAPSQCYVATAAAKGHSQYVGSITTQTTSGDVVIVNLQLQYLKCAELAVKTIFPRLHHSIRKVYDLVGPRCVRWLRHPLAADAAYTSLKPIEWLVRFMFVMFAPRVNSVARRLFCQSQQSNVRLLQDLD